PHAVPIRIISSNGNRSIGSCISGFLFASRRLFTFLTPARRSKLVTPGVKLPIQTSPRSLLPLRLRRKAEAEWEKAARGGLNRKLYTWGDELGAAGGGEEGEQAATGEKKARYAAPDGPVAVGTYDPNGYGVR